MSNPDDNFFSRWSRRKVQVRTGQALPPEPPAPAPPAPGLARVATPPVPAAPEKAAAPAAAAPPPAVSDQPPLPTLDDVARLTREADFSPFVGRQVPAEVRNAAMKKLFTDPRYNVMDGLDIYIDDYSQPSPLSTAMMAKMVGAQFLKLVDEPNDAAPAAAPTARVVEAPGVLQADPAVAPPEPAEAAADTPTDTDTPTSAATAPAQPETPHDHADLQLQPDHAPERESPGPGAG